MTPLIAANSRVTFEFQIFNRDPKGHRTYGFAATSIGSQNLSDPILSKFLLLNSFSYLTWRITTSRIRFAGTPGQSTSVQPAGNEKATLGVKAENIGVDPSVLRVQTTESNKLRFLFGSHFLSRLGFGSFERSLD
jgi:hypothetical protein